jgi:hypothetical protein
MTFIIVNLYLLRISAALLADYLGIHALGFSGRVCDCDLGPPSSLSSASGIALTCLGSVRQPGFLKIHQNFSRIFGLQFLKICAKILQSVRLPNRKIFTKPYCRSKYINTKYLPSIRCPPINFLSTNLGNLNGSSRSSDCHCKGSLCTSHYLRPPE